MTERGWPGVTGAGTVERGPAPAPDPLAVLRSRDYLRLLLLGLALGIPISFAAYFFPRLVARLQRWVSPDLPWPHWFGAAPSWWPVPPVVAAGLLGADGLAVTPLVIVAVVVAHVVAARFTPTPPVAEPRPAAAVTVTAWRTEHPAREAGRG